MRSVSSSLLALVLLAGLAAAQNQALQVLNTQPSGHFDVANVAGLAPANITVEAWVTYDETTLTPPPTFVWPTIIRKNFAAGGEEYFLRVGAGNTANRVLTWKVVTSGGAVNCSWAFPAGALLTPTHVAATWDGATARLLINGAEVATATGSGAIIDNGGAVRVGNGDAATPEFWNGFLDDVRLWSVARTDAEINSTMFTSVQVAPNLEAAWILDGDALDYTGNGHDGTLVQPATFLPFNLPTPTFQVNSQAASLDIDGQSSGVFSANVVERCPGQGVSLNFAGTPGPWELVATVGTTPVPDTTGLLAPWRINVPLNHPTTTFVFGLAFNPANPLPTVTLPVNTLATEVDAQFVVIDGAQPLGLALSSAVGLRPNASLFQASIPGPTADDTPLGPIDITAAPLNCPPVTFYGTTYSNIWVNPNGRVSFTAGNAGFTPSVATYLVDPPSLGVWTDWSPNITGSITIGKDCNGLFTVRWSNVPYFGQGAASALSSYDVTFDPATLDWTIANLTGVAPSTSAQTILVGACPGNAAPGGPATDPGPQDFTQAAGFPALASDAMYEIGTATTYGALGGVLGGTGGVFPVNSITFTPQATGYFWTSL